jgi:GTP cyclohydrolase III
MSKKTFRMVREAQKGWPEATWIVVWDVNNNTAYHTYSTAPHVRTAALVEEKGDQLTIITNLDGQTKYVGGETKVTRCVTIAHKEVTQNGKICYRGIQDGIWLFTIYDETE